MCGKNSQLIVRGYVRENKWYDIETSSLKRDCSLRTNMTRVIRVSDKVEDVESHDRGKEKVVRG